MDNSNPKSVAVIVAHPDDETLWAGGTILGNPSWNWFIVCLSRKSDKDRAPKFLKTLQILGSEGIMGDIDDGPEQKPLEENELEQTILKLMPHSHFDLIISHNPFGEYTRHRRHEETGKAVINLWHTARISANELWIFAYEDGNKDYYPRPIKKSSYYYLLAEQIWQKKYSIITAVYGFNKDSFEANTTPKAESFWKFTEPYEALKWLENGGIIS
jgi:LmbE family N-acetylglucosaminyl deacetylase